MNQVSICSGCGRTIEKAFIYCPWCGISKLSVLSEDEKIEQVFTQLEQMQKDNRNERIEQMNDRLGKLEKELDALVLCAEMHK